jgi:hypothetical protein
MASGSYEIRLPSQIDNSNIKLGKTFKYGDNYHLTNIYYLESSVAATVDIKETDAKRQDAVDEKTKLIIQTPLMYIPNSMIYFNDKPFLELSFNNEENDKDVLAFHNWITKLEEHLFKLIKRRTTIGCTKEGLSTAIKIGSGRVSSKLLVPVNLNVSKCLLNDDGKRNKILFNWEIPVPTYGISIIWVKNIWVKKGKWGLNLFMYATRVMNSHILDPVDFLDMDVDNKSIKTVDVINKFSKDEKMSILVGQVPEYSMYFKMLKLGIPKDAVKQKMSLIGVNPLIIDYPENAPYASVLHYLSNPHLKYPNLGCSNISLSPPPHGFPDMPGVPPPPPPPIPGSLVLNNNSNRIGILNEISKGGFKLKKVDPEELAKQNKEKMVSKLSSNIPSGMKVPSLGDIQIALSRLKKLNLEPEGDLMK